MKYIKEYMEEELKIKALGKIDFEELGDTYDGGKFGYAVLIDGKDIGLQIWWSDYATWLENKLDTKLSTSKKIDISKSDKLKHEVIKENVDKYSQVILIGEQNGKEAMYWDTKDLTETKRLLQKSLKYIETHEKTI